MAVTLDDDARQYLATFEEVTGADGTDCILDSGRTDVADGGEADGTAAADSGGEGNGTADRLIIVVASGQMGEAIGPEGRTIKRFEDRVDLPVRLVENAADPETFVANTLAPAAVYNVTISENNDTVAYVEVADADRGIAIGSNGRTIEAARTLAQRHFEIDDIQLT
ncbi:transcription elongation factor NusA [Natrialba magadii ATCC 43099]|uniref:Probable transcription termination protein NusA n=1 Tax=Natrialba magadii (strain ATCC 43099 / DSM 3394 / CCM 3739 / CIP 104546 / IAM 13178 / JCM 8861 / NBRC 102185 / NCIMB 2190 / MS3) TaxID=547559 RepID=D3SW62_NATMM|nr:NusA-like transcription termination signal-binding factor [Natrialba magadii]ADD05723.1 transcription elongation factor NusA [Natrialba magadii ATCC 43099]ELY29866.1 transcription elongation factor NusA-like protein [Natrialba magadii ATCC 43099]